MYDSEKIEDTRTVLRFFASVETGRDSKQIIMDIAIALEGGGLPDDCVAWHDGGEK